MENNLSNLLFITVEDVKESKLWQPINDRKQSAYNDNLIYNAILKTSLWMDRLSGGTISDKINKKDLFPWVKKDNTGLIEYDKWLSYIKSACLLAVINWYLPKGVNDLTGSASFSQGGVAYSQTNDPEANENITRDVKNALKLAGETIDIISSKTSSRPYNYSLDNYAHPWEEEYKYITKKTFYPTLLFYLKERVQTDNTINITHPEIIDYSKIDYNEYIKLVVPFDNDTIYYDEINKVWKTNTGNIINPEYVMKTLNPNDFAITEGDNNKDKISVTNGYNDQLAIDDPTSSGEFVNYMKTRQIGIKLIPTQSGKPNASFNQKTGKLEIWDPAFKNNDITANFEIIKTSTTSELKLTDDTLPTTKYINEHYQLKGSGSNDWEVINTNDFVPNNTQYILPITPNGIYKYKVELGYLKENKTIYKSSLIFSEKKFDKNYDVVVGNTFQFSGLPIFTISISLRKGYQNAIINLLNQNGVKYEMQTLSIERKKVI